MDKLKRGITLEDGEANVDKIDYVYDRPMSEVGVEIHIGKNRIVRRLFEALGYTVEGLDRTMLGHLTKKNLPRGHWRLLTDKEISFLKML
jgi:23S rRNA pseudouridine2605 synthase